MASDESSFVNGRDPWSTAPSRETQLDQRQQRYVALRKAFEQAGG